MADHRLLRPSLVVTAAVSATALLAAILLATTPPMSWEVRAFDLVNGLPDTPFVVWWPVMQLGSLAGAVLVTIAISSFRPWHVGGSCAMATGLAWLGAQAMKYGVGRQRPTGLGVTAMIRGSEAAGAGFPSGHAAVSFAAAMIVFAHLRGWWRAVPFAVAALVSIDRVYVGAHMPLDVVGGAVMGTAIGIVVTVLTSHDAPRRTAAG